MKSKKVMMIQFMALDELAESSIQNINDRKKSLQPKNTIYFDSWTSFRSFMTLQKLEILTMISSVQPKSIYELSRLLDRSLSAVQKDSEMLERVGFIILKKQKTGRGSITPSLVFDYDKIVVNLPKHPYALTFKAA
jgi:predicted transcriptional regulator